MPGGTNMNPSVSTATLYPENDGNPLAENSTQFKWIMKLFGNIHTMFGDRPDVFVASDLLWYHDKDNPDKRLAPDVMVVFGRPDKHRSTYLQWDEDDIPAQVVFEIRSPSNDDEEMTDKLQDYDEWGVQEYYVYDPDRNIFQIYERGLQTLRLIRPTGPYFSKSLKIRFELTRETLEVYYPNGEPFLFLKAAQEQRIEAQRQRAEAEQRADAEQRQRLEAEQRYTRFRELSRKARLQQATPDELAELERLELES